MEQFNDRMEKLNQLIKVAKNIVFFGGAGVSTESGIPDFRSKNGLYNQKDHQFDSYEPEYLLSKNCLKEHPDVFFEFYRQKLDVRNINPNITHKKLAELEKAGKLSAIITQNIDGLHQKAGSHNVYEIHGTTNRAYCSKCLKKVNPMILFEKNSGIPRCSCGGMLRPDVTLYGEPLPSKAWLDSIKCLSNSDLFIIGGTSLAVWPASTLIQYYYGENMIIINNTKTSYDRYASLIFRESIGKVFENIVIS